MRKLNTSDIFVAGRLIKKLNIKEKIKNIYSRSANVKTPEEASKEVNNEDYEKEVESIGFDAIWLLLEEALESNMEEAIYEFLSRPFEVSPKDVERMEIEKLIENIQILVKENNLTSFFKQVGL